MQSAARRLVGHHDFAAFAPPFDGDTHRTLRRCDVRSTGKEIVIELEARAFLPHQVRRMVGPLVNVGLGKLEEEGLVALLNEAVPSSAGPAAPACGLYLVEVRYEGFGFSDRPDNREEDGNVHT
jgi:tRNA pseudouridine38-40 synthase